MITWTCIPFNDLNPAELYAILKLRSQVFVVEQNCVYLDCDDKDHQSHHLCGWENNSLVAYSRLMPPGLAYEDASIGRVITSFSIRRTGAGKELMHVAMKKVEELFQSKSITISAQFYLRSFYESLGFLQVSDVYLEDHIDHIKMVYTKS